MILSLFKLLKVGPVIDGVLTILFGVFLIWLGYKLAASRALRKMGNVIMGIGGLAILKGIVWMFALSIVERILANTQYMIVAGAVVVLAIVGFVIFYEPKKTKK